MDLSTPESDISDISVTKPMTASDFLKLHDYIKNYCSHSIKEVLVQLQANGTLKMENYDKGSSVLIDFEGYRLLMQNYIETDIPEVLLRNSFLSFISISWDIGDESREPVKTGMKLATKGNTKRETLSQFIRRLQELSKAVLSMPQRACSDEIVADEDLEVGCNKSWEWINVKELVCFFTFLEAGSPEDKLEFVFKIYDADGNGFLDATELEHIVDQMTALADKLQWDVDALKPILQRMIVGLDANSDGQVSLTEWKNAGVTTVPLLALLGMETSHEGCHKFVMKHFKRPTYCNRCRRLLFGLRKQGLRCTLCKFTVHEQCAELEVLHGCITTYSSKCVTQQEMNPHHWIEGNLSGKCSQCNKMVTNLTGLSGWHCRWCQRTVHDSCHPTVSIECDFGDLRHHILRPSSLFAPNASCALDLQIRATPGVVPLLVLINRKSGGKQGSRLMRIFRYLLNPRQVFDLANGGPVPGLNFFKEVSTFKVLCCGGDGTVGWMLEEMDKIQFSQRPPVAILPLGTGNDLARCLGWGGGYEGEDLNEIFNLIEKSRIVQMDRWYVEKTTLPDIEVNDRGDFEVEEDKIPVNIMNNYFSVGVDASIALRFHNMREKHPEKFSSRTRNKLWYLEFGTIETLQSDFKNLQEDIEIECDDVPLSLPEGTTLECIAVLNIGSVYGGTNLWGSDGNSQRKLEKQGNRTSLSALYDNTRSPDIVKDIDLARVEQDLGDGLLEVVGLESCIHLAQVKSGIHKGKRLCQCSKITIRTKQKFPMQIDGEPWFQDPCQITITHHNRASMLMSPIVRLE